MSRPVKCRYCHKRDEGAEWLAKGTGRCGNCARARLANETSNKKARDWYRMWADKLDSCLGVVLPLRMGRYR